MVYLRRLSIHWIWQVGLAILGLFNHFFARLVVFLVYKLGGCVEHCTIRSYDCQPFHTPISIFRLNAIARFIRSHFPFLSAQAYVLFTSISDNSIFCQINKPIISYSKNSLNKVMFFLIYMF